MTEKSISDSEVSITAMRFGTCAIMADIIYREKGTVRKDVLKASSLKEIDEIIDNINKRLRRRQTTRQTT